ncbi:class I SAM-dependent methyltransferase [Natronomonas amylolytica]|uniref:class I SAM-dependent methyltransferase n=1 Tax=Natronomonas amylolytica TaxID=3108498 RepID=UPI00300A9C68
MKDAIKANFDASVSAYDAYERRTGRFAALARLLYAEMAARGDGTLDALLDAGAGSGVSTRVFGEAASRTVALDISREMLRENSGSPCIQGDFDHLPFADGTFDGVAFTASLFLVPDPTVAVEEAERVLRTGGVVGAVAPLGWYTDDGTDVFETLDRDSRSPTRTDDVEAALAETFAVSTGTWRFATTADDLRLFHEIPAMAARLYPRLSPDERVEKAVELLDTVDGTLEQRWRWIVGVSE